MSLGGSPTGAVGCGGGANCGALASSQALPAIGAGAARACTDVGVLAVPAAGLVTLSTDGAFVVAPCYDAPEGGAASGALSTSPAAAVPRVFARLTARGLLDTSASASGPTGVPVSGAASTDLTVTAAPAATALRRLAVLASLWPDPMGDTR